MTTESSDRRRSLVIELGTATVVLDGRRLELPAKKFRLLAELAARPGEPIPAEALLERVWPDVHGMTPQDLYWHIWRLRQALGDTNRDDKLVAHRRGYGYLIDLPKDAVRIVEAEEPLPPSTLQEASSTSEIEDSQSETVPETERGEHSSSKPRLRVPSLTSMALAMGLCTAAWFAGFGAARLTAPPAPSNGKPMAPEVRRAEEPTHAPARSSPRRSRNPQREPGHRRVNPTRGEVPVAAPVVPNQQPGSVTQASEPTGQGTSEHGREVEKNATVAAPAPNGYLYHLFDRKSGDHFVTTDGDAVDEYRGRGYSGSAVARVYTYAERRAPIRGISLNFGQAYVFTASSPETTPKIAPVKLFYAANGQGDFFYTTERAEASADGWKATFVGYAGSL